MKLQLLQSAWHRWFTELHARVVTTQRETADTTTFVLAVSRAWPGHRAGQYVPVEVEIDGVRMRRCYSISSGGSAPGRGLIAITVKRVPGGRVSPWLHAHLVPGALVRLGAPAGDFCLPPGPPGPLLLVGAGSGITPIRALAIDLAARAAREVVVLEVARTDADAIAAAAPAAHPTWRIVAHRGHLTAAALHAAVPDLAQRAVYVCGPAGLADLVEAAGGSRTVRERFGAGAATSTAGAIVQLDGRRHVIGGGTLLEALERAGERPAYGCRAGICQTCRCTKRSGVTEDVITGAVSHEPGPIRLCVSIARSDLELAR